MSREFDGADDRIVTTIAAGLASYTYGTWGVLIRLTGVNTAWNGIMNLHNTALTTATAGLERDDTATNPRLYLAHGGASRKTATGVQASDDWQFCIITKTTGTTTPRFHRRLDTNAVSWTHADMDGTLADGALSTSARMVFGEWQGTDDASMRLAVAFIIDEVALSDAEVEACWPNNSVGSTDLLTGHSVNFTHIWEFNQASTAINVTDLKGNGGDQSAINGTAVSADNPVDWSYSSSATNLTVADATHGHTADSPTLTQLHVLTVADATHGHTVDSPALTQVHSLTVADATHGHSVDNVTLTQAHNLAVADASHSHTVDSPALTQLHILTVADATHAHTADNVAVSSNTISLTVADAQHVHTVDTPTLTQLHALTVAETRHLHTVDNVTLSLGLVVTPEERIYSVPAVTPRILAVAASPRVCTVDSDPRVREIEAEDRTYVVTTGI